MIPSLVAGQLREAIVEYLSTTFALSDDETRAALGEFLGDPSRGIFRGPYLRVRTPFRKVDDDWDPPLDWLPDGFRPYLHQAQAFERLSSRDGEPKPTLVTTGTGSGKTESFLFPVLDYCIRVRNAGATGVKALLLYPMNALATDQARRIAKLIDGDHRLGGITAGIYIGGVGGHSAMGPDHLIDERSALRTSPPDILLTNYKMLDFLLLRPEDHDLWVSNQPGTLRYVVLDEFHTYDGAQGTDVAMLLRRLGATLGVATPEHPLGSITPVGTSATLGSGATAASALREFAGRVFGAEFDDGSIVGESRQTPDEACGTIDYGLPIPEVDDILEPAEDDPDLLTTLAALFTDKPDPMDPVELGSLLVRHPLTWAVLSAGADQPRDWSQAVDLVVTRAPNWGRIAQQDPLRVHQALARYLALLSTARRAGPTEGSTEPLFAIEVQLWVREVSRLLRSLSATPSFRWLDSAPEDQDEEEAQTTNQPVELPAVYCRHCGRAGWMAVASELDGSLKVRANNIYQQSQQHTGRVRALIRASVEEDDAVHLEPLTAEVLSEPTDTSVPVLMTVGEDQAKRDECPSCGRRDGIRFLGSQVASLASVSISQLFGSQLVHTEERKLLAFTDSVQDAAHRAAFFAGRTHRFNLRTTMAAIAADHGELSLADLGGELLAAAGTDRSEIHALVPPDLLRHPTVRTTWTEHPKPAGRRVLEQRLALEADLEFGLRARVGRTLELTGSVVAGVRLDEPQHLADLALEAQQHVTGQQALDLGDADHETYVRGLLERLRLSGGILHPWLDAYLREDGNQWRIWGGRPDGMPAFPSGQSRPSFYTTGKSENLDSVTANPRTPTWLVDWAVRTLDVEPSDAPALNRRVLELLAAEDVVTTVTTNKGNTVFGLAPESITVVDLVEPEDAEAAILRCGVCAGRHVVAPIAVERWLGRPCLRYRCPGTYEAAPPDGANYYRSLYRSGSMRRVVTAEHTGLLERGEREDLERLFKDGGEPDAPNVIACTPTMELGIDIGDLSAVLLTSVPRQPASYVQRVGRAGRLSGNAFVAAFIPTEPRSLYYLEQPEHMIAGDVRPPNCYLDAIEILRRQYLAYLLDRAADGVIDAPAMPREMGKVVNDGLVPEGWLRPVVDASTVDADLHVARFLDLFGAEVTPETRAALEEFATHGLELAVKAAFEDWGERYAEFTRRRDRLKAAIERLEQQAHLDEDDERDLKRLRGERSAVIGLMKKARGEYPLTGLEKVGLLPNYTLLDDAATLEAALWSHDDEDNFVSETRSYQRPASLALTEFAPGNSFYVQGHRLVIDALELGSATEPLYTWWRLCPDCGYGAPEDSQDSWSSCPRCSDASIADTGARHLMLEMRQVYCADSEERARVFDESDDRDRERYTVATSVDVDPLDVVEGWEKEATLPFGVELARTAVIRAVNLGPAARPGEKVGISGRDHTAARFPTCRYCGSVKGIRPQARNEHRGWCPVRSGARKEQWDNPVLYHELRTEAVRILLPLATFEVDERLASFKAALLLGLRLDFGGEPEHLAVVTADAPGGGGPGRRRFLVLHDTVPGGTGYLGRVADPDRLKVILEKAREAISRCPCREEGRIACHRCLLGAVAPSELELVSRPLALELLEQLLETWEFTQVHTIGDLDIGLVEESELERRFKVALRAWAARSDTKATITTKPAGGLRESLEIRLGDGDDTVRWVMEEQVDLFDVSPKTRPDYVLTRQDAPAPEIAIYLDGYQFHAAPEHKDRLADDASKRDAVRHSGRLVWNLTWQDVVEFHKAAEAEVPKDAPDRPLLSGAARKTAARVHHQLGGDGFDISLLDHNPVRQLLELLRRPDVSAWERLSLSALAGVASKGEQGRIDREEVREPIEAALRGQVLPTGSEGSVMTVLWSGEHGFVLAALLDCRDEVGGPNAERWTVFAVLDDSDHAVAEPLHHARWRDWLQWANLLQFVRSGGRDAVVEVVSRSDQFEVDDLSIVPLAAPAEPVDLAMVESAIADDALEELELLQDGARPLVESVVRGGAPSGLVAGFEPDEEGEGWIIEAAWPDLRVGVVVDEDPDRDAWLASNGWDTRRADAWTESTLRDALMERT